MKCQSTCVIENLKPQKDGPLMLRHLSASHSSQVKFLNLRSTVVTKEFLDEMGQFVQGIQIVDSLGVQQIILSKQFNLLHLDISNSRLRFFEIEGHVRLLTLVVSSGLLKKIPPTFRYLHAATVIEISECPIVTLDLAPFCSTFSLRALKLTKNKIRYIVNSSTVPCSPQMKQIELDENHIQVLNLELFSTSSRLLRAGFVRKNAIELVVGRFTSSSLLTLALSGNYLTRLDVCQWNTPALSSLHIGSNRLSDVPRCLGNLSQLDFLVMHRNRFTNFDIRSVAKLKHLRFLNLALNNLSSFAMSDKEFPPSLNRLYLGYNRLESLDLSYVPVPSCEVYVSNNLIGELDIDKVSLNVTLLDMGNNPLDCSWDEKKSRRLVKCIKNPNFDPAEAYNGDSSKVLERLT
ncbi:AGAP005668-PA-like protein [Anopheles sinensis]|uniref:AGAP005668-PA-like protein n=1 Tax=Anopheles sinensis TaxID=74873 RepID=A0A084W3A9_ANOSI|nr:AGAP005668-PA-like protein [Anopheles sinensis]